MFIKFILLMQVVILFACTIWSIKYIIRSVMNVVNKFFK